MLKLFLNIFLHFVGDKTPFFEDGVQLGMRGAMELDILLALDDAGCTVGRMNAAVGGARPDSRMSFLTAAFLLTRRGSVVLVEIDVVDVGVFIRDDRADLGWCCPLFRVDESLDFGTSVGDAIELLMRRRDRGDWLVGE